ncbi:uncharacterized protein LAESUDRAFT_701511 [Laetiporus sulphureus 93-53]|uniref:Uncharacterized protein n=1 Tax=Laetiporus sulphureus 93-53 TaxID=1314785 RepID=A0A165E049_9APHY|nr:uncharacterized protein LAESUDRAFT_701511 [Laetiporus sulphureus 93-53]KZT05989.1 hypothetical protein LAESUDRAFT_701511 [Laetiporus sulphureus 93-53]
MNPTNPTGISSSGSESDPSGNLAHIYNSLAQLSRAFSSATPPQNLAAPFTAHAAIPAMSQTSAFLPPFAAASLSQANPVQQSSLSRIVGTGASAPQANALLAQLITLLAPQTNVAPLPAPDINPAMQALVDMLKMSTPVGSFPDDQMRLVQALHESESKGQTYRQALEALNGVNNHSAAMWKDYYLDHAKRIERLIANLRASNAEEKWPTSSTLSRSTGQSAHLYASSSSSPVDYVQRSPYPSPSRSNVSSSSVRPTEAELPRQNTSNRRAHPSSSRNIKTGTSSRQQTRMSTRAQDDEDQGALGSRKTARQKKQRGSISSSSTRVNLPRWPSRSPTPPEEVIANVTGQNLYTIKDKDFFVKLLQWELGKNPELQRESLCKLLAVKVPHHSLASWSSYWHRNKNIVDKVLNAAKSLPEPSSSENDTNTSQSVLSLQESIDEESDIELLESETDPPTDEDVQHMGSSGDLVRKADLRVLAKYIVARPDWDDLTRSDRFAPYVAKYPKRSFEAYAQIYDRKKSGDKSPSEEV